MGFYAANELFMVSLLDCKSDEEYIEMCAQKAREEAQETLKHSLRPFEEVKASFVPTNMSRDEFNRILRLMEKE